MSTNPPVASPASPPATVEQVLQQAITQHQSGRLTEAEILYGQVLQLDPGNTDSLHLCGVIAHQSGRHEQAVELIRQAIALNAGVAAFHANLGVALKAQGQLNEAIDSYERALAITPEVPDWLSNLGVALQSLGRGDEARAKFDRALAVKPDHTGALSNLGIYLQDQGKLEQAVGCFERALAINPHFADARINLAGALFAQGQFERAMIEVLQALQQKETPSGMSIFSQCFTQLNFESFSAGHLTAVIHLAGRALDEAWTRPIELALPCLSLFKRDPVFRNFLAEAGRAWPTRLPEAAVANVWNSFFGNRLLLSLLRLTVVPNLEFEQALTCMRLRMLEHALRTQVADDNPTLDGFCAMAQQCFINEYVFALLPGEIEQVQTLSEQVVTALDAGRPVSAIKLMTVASYLPLSALPGAERLLQIQWPAMILPVLRQQVAEPQEEMQLRGTIPCWMSIDDDISMSVREQYEENPYPRWVKTPPAIEMVSVDAFLHKTFPQVPFHNIGKSGAIEILIAGCGTGQHPIHTAQRFPNARVRAIDLSLSSLSYAKRKAQELGIKNLEFGQADILRLHEIGDRFDVIETFGVLHHLGDPMQGLKSLLSILRPGGFIGIGLYSELARRGVVAGRRFITEQKYGDSADDIRRCRQQMIALADGTALSETLRWSDFFSVSECRDLLFHVQEHRMTVLDIHNFLARFSLSFLGFQIDQKTSDAYQSMFPEDRAMTSLQNWHRFETARPTTFRTMYQFWAQKPL